MNKRVKYNRCPLVEVIFQLRFPTILSINSKQPADFQEKIRKEDPFYDEGIEEQNELLINTNGKSAQVKSSQNKNYSFVSVAYTRKLSLDTDIFSGLPEFVFENKKVDRFLNVLKNVIAMSDLEGVTLSKLHLSEYNEATISIEWIFNYFRAYFSFESDDEDSYGMIENNKENQEFSNYFRKLKPEEYELVAKSVLDYIIMMGGFGKR